MVVVMSKFLLGEKENALLHDIYAAALAPEKWQGLIADIAVAIGAPQGTFTVHHAQNPARILLRVDVGVQQSGILIQTPPGESPPSNDFVFGFPARVDTTREANDSQLLCSSIVFRSFNPLGELRRNALVFLQQLAPHIARAICIANQVGAFKQQHYSLVESLKCSNLAVFFLDTDLRVVFSTQEADRILADNPALRIGRSGQLEINDRKQQLLLDEQLHRLMVSLNNASQPSTYEPILPLHLPNKVHPLKVSALALSDPAGFAGAIRLGLFVSDPERRCLIAKGYLQQAYRFTRTETLIAQMIVNGSGVADIAAQRHTSLETTRWQVKSLLQKTHTKSQAELTRLLMLLTGESVRTGQRVASIR